MDSVTATALGNAYTAQLTLDKFMPGRCKWGIWHVEAVLSHSGKFFRGVLMDYNANNPGLRTMRFLCKTGDARDDKNRPCYLLGLDDKPSPWPTAALRTTPLRNQIQVDFIVE